MTREEFFNKLNNGAKWDVGVAINRTNPLPLDANEIFDSTASMEGYIKSNALAYPGQIVVVLGETETAAYLVNAVGGEGKGYSKLAATTGSGDVGEELTKLAQRVSAIEGYFEGGIAKKATADAEGNVISSTYATQAALATAEQNITDNSTAIGKAQGDITALQGTVDTLMPKAGGEFTGAVTVQAPTADMNPATKKYVDDAIGGITGVEFTVVDELPTTGEAGVIYLVAHSHGEQDIYDEYIWVTDKFEKIGNTDIDLSQYAKKADLKADPFAVGVGETVKSISETDGIISVEKQAIAIEQSQVNGLADILAGKQAANANLDKFNALEGEGLVKKTAEGYAIDSNQYLVSGDLSDYAKSADVTNEISEAVKDKQTATQVNDLIAAATIEGSKVNGNVAQATLADTATKVSNALTAGKKTYNGSEAVEITAADLGALTEVPQATAEAFGGIKTGHIEGNNEHAVVLDTEGKAYVTVPMPEALTYGVLANGGLAVNTNREFSIADGGVVTAMIGDGQVTDAKISAVNVNKLVQTEGDELILNGGDAGVKA
nr:MAG TPA: hypothetical protein [Caudoviricetes sp.]